MATRFTDISHSAALSSAIALGSVYIYASLGGITNAVILVRSVQLWRASLSSTVSATGSATLTVTTRHLSTLPPPRPLVRPGSLAVEQQRNGVLITREMDVMIDEYGLYDLNLEKLPGASALK